MSDDKATVDAMLGLLEGVQALAPLFDAAEGMKADLERRGWSPTVAESTAHHWMLLVMTQIWSTNK